MQIYTTYRQPCQLPSILKTQKYLQLFTFRTRSCRKVIFSQACVSHSVHGEGSAFPLYQGTDRHTNWPGGRPPHQAAGRPPWPGDRRPTPRRYVQQAGSMHPTGMYTCSFLFNLFFATDMWKVNSTDNSDISTKFLFRRTSSMGTSEGN